MNANILKKSQFIFFITLVILACSCRSGCNHSKLNVDVSSVSLKIDFLRFDQDLFQCKTAEDLFALRKKYNGFYDDFVFKVMGFVPTKDDTFCIDKTLELIKNKDILSLYDSTQKVFSEDNYIRDGISDAIKHYKYYFKEDSIPKFIAFLSVLTYPNTISENYIGIGLDMFLGKSFTYYYDTRLNFPQYYINYLSKEYLLRKTLFSFIEQRFESEPSAVFIERAVQQGRYYYLLDAMCPEMPDSIKLEYTAEKLKWMKGVEQEMWIDLVNRKVLYGKDRFENDKYFTPGPFTNAPNVSQDSPPRVGEWLGWQIVSKYMESNPNVTVSELMQEKDLLKIFKNSGYRPK